MMRITRGALRRLVGEAISKDKIVAERPWSVEYSFRLSDGDASDSEGLAPDGFAVVMTGESGTIVKVYIDTYWNPQAGDTSGNSIKVEVDGRLQGDISTYCPVKFDDGKEQLLVLSNSPVQGFIAVSHSPSKNDTPVTYLIFSNPFDVAEDVSFSIENLGGGKADVKMVRHTNL